MGERSGLAVVSDCGLGDVEGVAASFGGRIFLEVCQDVLRKPESRRGRF